MIIVNLEENGVKGWTKGQEVDLCQNGKSTEETTKNKWVKVHRNKLQNVPFAIRNCQAFFRKNYRNDQKYPRRILYHKY